MIGCYNIATESPIQSETTMIIDISYILLLILKDMSPRLRLGLAKGVVKFLSDDDSKVLEFWQIWSESIPGKDELSSGMAIDFHVCTSADMQKLQWRVGGPQNVFIQKMVDFFWNVGAPESEIDRLNDVGALINPVKIGSWIGTL
jgi:hypothetical protein